MTCFWTKINWLIWKRRAGCDGHVLKCHRPRLLFVSRPLMSNSGLCVEIADYQTVNKTARSSKQPACRAGSAEFTKCGEKKTTTGLLRRILKPFSVCVCVTVISWVKPWALQRTPSCCYPGHSSVKPPVAKGAGRCTPCSQPGAKSSSVIFTVFTGWQTIVHLLAIRHLFFLTKLNLSRSTSGYTRQVKCIMTRWKPEAPKTPKTHFLIFSFHPRPWNI